MTEPPLSAVPLLSEHPALLRWQFSVASRVQEAGKGEKIGTLGPSPVHFQERWSSSLLLMDSEQSTYASRKFKKHFMSIRLMSVFIPLEKSIIIVPFVAPFDLSDLFREVSNVVRCFVLFFSYDLGWWLTFSWKPQSSVLNPESAVHLYSFFFFPSHNQFDRLPKPKVKTLRMQRKQVFRGVALHDHAPYFIAFFFYFWEANTGFPSHLRFLCALYSSLQQVIEDGAGCKISIKLFLQSVNNAWSGRLLQANIGNSSQPLPAQSFMLLHVWM